MNKEAIIETLQWIERFSADLERIKTEFADNPKLLKLYGGQTWKEIQTLFRGLLSHVGLKTLPGAIAPGSFSLYGLSSDLTKITLHDLKNFLHHLEISLGTAEAQHPDQEKTDGYYVSGFSDGSLHLTIEPTNKGKDLGLKAISRVAQSIEILKNNPQSSQDPVVIAVKGLLPKFKGRISRIEFGGAGIIKEAITLQESREIKKHLSATKAKEPNERTLTGMIVAIDGETLTSQIRTPQGKIRFTFPKAKLNQIKEAVFGTPVSISLKKMAGKWHLEEIK